MSEQEYTNKKAIVAAIKQRILDEQRKHKDLDWAEIAARKIYSTHLSNEEKIKQAYEPYFGWCDVEGCDNEGANGGGCWRETGYWTVCSEHSSDHRAGNPQPKMKQSAIDRESRRDEDGFLTNEV